MGSIRKILARLAPDGLLHQSLVVVLLSWTITQVPVNVEFLAPFEIALREFEYTDVITSQIQDDENPRIDTAIVLVNIGNASRIELARTIQTVFAAGAACIGVDAIFGASDDSLGADALADVTRNRPNIVMGEVLLNPSLYGDSMVCHGRDRGVLGAVPGIAFANVNLPGSTTFKTVRYWHPTSRYGDSSSTSMAMALARNVLRDSLFPIQQSQELFIKYQRTKTWYTVEWSDCVSGLVDPQTFRGRIVLLGFMGQRLGDTLSIEDRFFTPLNNSYIGRTWPDAYGVEIHATVLSMLIHNDIVAPLHGSLDFIIAFGIAISVLAVHRVLTIRLQTLGETIARLLQIGMLIAVFAGLAVLLIDYNCVLSIDVSVACAVLCLDIATVYDGVAGSLFRRGRRYVRRMIVNKRRRQLDND